MDHDPQKIFRHTPDALPADPWAKFHAWRYHPSVTRTNNLRRIFPGLGMATAAFGVYVLYESFVEKKGGSHH